MLQLIYYYYFQQLSLITKFTKSVVIVEMFIIVIRAIANLFLFNFKALGNLDHIQAWANEDYLSIYNTNNNLYQANNQVNRKSFNNFNNFLKYFLCIYF